MQLIELRLAWMIEILLGAGSNPVNYCAITELFIAQVILHVMKHGSNFQSWVESIWRDFLYARVILIRQACWIKNLYGFLYVEGCNFLWNRGYITTVDTSEDWNVVNLLVTTSLLCLFAIKQFILYFSFLALIFF